MKKLFLFIVGLWTWHTHCPAQLAQFHPGEVWNDTENCLLYTSDAADD